MSILAQIGTKIGSEIKNLDIRMSSAETAIVNLGGQQPPPTSLTINPVSWTNLTEINLSGEKLVNADFSNVSSQYVADSTLTSSGSGANPVKIIVLTSVNLQGTAFTAGAILHGVGGGGANNSLQRMEDPNDPRDYPYTTSNQNTGTWDWEPIADRGTTWEYAKEQNYPSNWSIHSGSLDQSKLAEGIVKGDGGAVTIRQSFSNPIASGTNLVIRASRADTNANTLLVRLIGSSGNPYVNLYIDPQDGFIEFETTQITHGLQVDCQNILREVSDVSLFQGEVSGGSVQVNGNGGIERISGSGTNGFNTGASSTNFIQGNSDGYVQFQYDHGSIRLGLTYEDVDYENIIPFKGTIAQGGDFWIGSDKVLDGSIAKGDHFRIRHYASDNTIRFQKKEEIFDAQNVSLGFDYVTFHIHSELTNGNNLYVDTSFQFVGSRLNDVLLAR